LTAYYQWVTDSLTVAHNPSGRCVLALVTSRGREDVFLVAEPG
jgi:hypothetical protein